jgi:hypothetical protein
MEGVFKKDTQGIFIGVYDPHVLMRSNSMICIVVSLHSQDYSCILALVSGAKNQSKSLNRRAIFTKYSFFHVVSSPYICHRRCPYLHGKL